MKRRDFVAKGGGFLGLSLARFGQKKEGKMQKEPVRDPEQVFLARISSIREEFQRCFNKDDWAAMETLYWEDAVLVSKKTNEVYQGRQEVIRFWRNFKEQKPGRMLKSIQPKSDKPLVRAVDLIGIMAMGEYNIYDLAAYDSCAYHFNPDDAVYSSLDSYRHRKTCDTALAEQIVEF